ncbi:MAG: hypothetical protein NT062_20050 [Proteobacteria bacterium]|nr:hypothetical protein [Pseudomonadota bacterium]
MRILRALLVLGLLAGAAGGAVMYLRRDRGPAPNPTPIYVVASENLIRRVTAEGNLRAVKATPLTVPQGQGWSGMKVAWLAVDGSHVAKGDVVVRFDPSEQQKQLREGQADLDSASARMSSEAIQGRAAVDGRDSAAVLAARELEQTRKFQQKDQEIYSRNQIIEAEIDTTLADAKKAHAEQTKKIERDLSHSKVAVISVEAQRAKLTIKNAKTALESMEIRAPHDGLFVLQRDGRGDVAKVGDQMWPGNTVAEIPLLETMEAEIFVLEVDGSGLQKDQAAEVVIESRPDTIYKGKVRLVDKLAKPRVRNVPIQYFAVVVELAATDVVAMKPGQRVQARLLLDQAQAIVVPRQAIFQKDGKSSVFKKTAKGVFESVPVELGVSTAGRVAVTTGLAIGDQIALRDPTRASDDAFGSGSAEAAAGGKQP